MAGRITANQLTLGDSGTAANNFELRTSADGTAKLARGAAGTLGDILTVPASGAAKIVGAQQLAQIQTFTTSALVSCPTLLPYDDTIPQITEGDECLSLAFTPTNASSTLEIDVVLNASNGVAGNTIAALFQVGTASALTAVVTYFGTADTMEPTAFKHVMTAGTTSAITFKVRAGNNGGATYRLNGTSAGRLLGGVAASRITIKEYLP